MKKVLYNFAESDEISFWLTNYNASIIPDLIDSKKYGLLLVYEDGMYSINVIHPSHMKNMRHNIIHIKNLITSVNFHINKINEPNKKELLCNFIKKVEESTSNDFVVNYFEF